MLRSWMGRRRRERFVEAEDDGLCRVTPKGRVHLLGWQKSDEAAGTPVSLDEPAGVLALRAADRSKFVLVFSSLQATRFVGVHADDPCVLHAILERAAPCSQEDVDRIVAQGTIGTDDAFALLETIAERRPSALSRVVSRTGGGRTVELSQACLRVDGATFDLRAPLERRTYAFRETSDRMVLFFDALWLRQGDREAVLVAQAEGLPRSEEKPPRPELVHSVERPLFGCFRHAVERAPRASRPSLPSMRLRERRP
jgi:hypothetical protein